MLLYFFLFSAYTQIGKGKENKMKTRKLGNIEVSEIGMGCMSFSHGYGAIPSREYAMEAIRNAYDHGCTFFDTAEVYGNVLYYEHHNEEIVGEALHDIRENCVIATKLHIHDDEVNENMYDVCKRHLLASLKALNTNYVDLYYLHRINPEVPVEKVAEAMGKLIDEGLIRGWSLSQVEESTIKRAHEVTPVSAVQNLYNMLERDCETNTFPYCLEHNIGVVPFSPIASGFLSGKITKDTAFEKEDDVRVFVPQLKKENIEANQPVIDLLNQYAALKNATNAQISIAWMLHKYPNVVPIPGSKNKERIIENLNANTATLTDEEFHTLEQALNSIKVYGHRGNVQFQGQSMKDWGKK